MSIQICLLAKNVLFMNFRRIEILLPPTILSPKLSHQHHAVDKIAVIRIFWSKMIAYKSELSAHFPSSVKSRDLRLRLKFEIVT